MTTSFLHAVEQGWRAGHSGSPRSTLTTPTDPHPPLAAALRHGLLQSPQTLRYVAGVGLRMPAHATSTGKVLLATLDRDVLRRRLRDWQPVQLTPYTIMSERVPLTALAPVFRATGSVTRGCRGAPVNAATAISRRLGYRGAARGPGLVERGRAGSDAGGSAIRTPVREHHVNQNQARATVASPLPRCAANNRLDQCVTPSFFK